LPSTLTFNYPNVGALAGYLERELTPSMSQGAGAITGTAATVPSTDNLDELSDEELESRLLARLSETR
jgi:hypothetical protein